MGGSPWQEAALGGGVGNHLLSPGWSFSLWGSGLRCPGGCEMASPSVQPAHHGRLWVDLPLLMDRCKFSMGCPHNLHSFWRKL